MALFNLAIAPRAPVSSYSPDLSGVLGAGGPTAVSLLSATGPVGAVISGAASIFTSIANLAKGKTKHISWDQALNLTKDWVGVATGSGVWPLFMKAYTYEQLQVIAQYVRPRFLQAMQAQWGTTTSQNQAIAADVAGNSAVNYALNRQLVMFMQWIGTNIDVDRAEDEFSKVTPVYFALIFLAAINDAGLDPSALGGTIPIPLGGGPTGDGQITSPTGTKVQAGAGSLGTDFGSLLFVGIILGGLVLFMKGK